MKRVLISCVMLTVTLGSATLGQAAFLIGSGTEKGNPTIATLNGLITSYNTSFSTSLSLIQAQFNKIEGEGNAAFANNSLLESEFDFFGEDSAGARSESIFNATVRFTAVLPSWGFSIDNNIVGFVYNGSQAIDYYLSKNGSGTYSLWLYTADPKLNPVYADNADNGYTRGSTEDATLQYDPDRFGVSHISFFRAIDQTPSVVPEPTAMSLFGVGSLGFAYMARRKRSNKTA